MSSSRSVPKSSGNSYRDLKITNEVRIKNYNNFNTASLPKTRQQLNNSDNYTNLNGMETNFILSLKGKKIFLWDMFGQKVKLVTMNDYRDGEIFYTISGKQIVTSSSFDIGNSHCEGTSWQHIDDKTLHLGIDKAGGCFYVKVSDIPSI